MTRSAVLLSIALLGAACGDKDTDSDGEEARIEGMNPGECSDGADNDADGDYDCDDSFCAGAPDCADGSDGSD